MSARSAAPATSMRPHKSRPKSAGRKPLEVTIERPSLSFKFAHLTTGDAVGCRKNCASKLAAEAHHQFRTLKHRPCARWDDDILRRVSQTAVACCLPRVILCPLIPLKLASERPQIADVPHEKFRYQVHYGRGCNRIRTSQIAIYGL